MSVYAMCTKLRLRNAYGALVATGGQGLWAGGKCRAQCAMPLLLCSLDVRTWRPHGRRGWLPSRRPRTQCNMRLQLSTHLLVMGPVLEQLLLLVMVEMMMMMMMMLVVMMITMMRDAAAWTWAVMLCLLLGRMRVMWGARMVEVTWMWAMTAVCRMVLEAAQLWMGKVVVAVGARGGGT